MGGTLAAGGANAFNMVIDRDIDAVMERTKRRPLVTGVMSARSATLFAFGLEVVAFAVLAVVGQPALGVARDLGDGVLRRHLHDGLEASLEAEHRHRWRRGRGAGAGGLGRRDELPRLDAGAAVPRHLHLDAAALLGARRALPRRLPRGQRADDARRRLAAPHHAGDPDLLDTALGADAADRPERAPGLGVRDLGDGARRDVHVVRASALPARAHRQSRRRRGDATLSLLHHVSLCTLHLDGG